MVNSILEIVKWVLKIFATWREEKLAKAKRVYAKQRAMSLLKKTDRARRAALVESVDKLREKD